MEGYCLDHAFKNYTKNNKNKAQKFKVTRSTYKKVCKAYNEMIVNLILEESMEVELPYNLGAIRIKKSQTNLDRLRPDWKATNELWANDLDAKARKQLIYHLNEHSDGWKAGWFWVKQHAIVPNKLAYSFTPTWSNKRRLAGIMQEEGGFKRFYE